MNATRHGTALKVAAALSAVAGLVAAGCIRAPWKDVSESAVTLHLACTVGYVVDTTAIVALSVVPDSPATMTVPATATIKVTEAAGTTGETATPVAALGGFRLDAPLLIHDRGRETVSFAAGSGAVLRLVDGYGNHSDLSGLSFSFDHTGRGVTNLPTEGTIVMPMAGGPFSLGHASFSGLAPGTHVVYSVATANSLHLSDAKDADASGIVLFGNMPTSIAGNISSASATFGP